LQVNLLFIKNKNDIWIVCFAHIFGGGYAAGYYAYLWTQMLADDGYQWFVEQGGLTRENGQIFRDAILSRGNSSDLEALYRDWRGTIQRLSRC
jgi:peptidyl-dipeptidase Dcp